MYINSRVYSKNPLKYYMNGHSLESEIVSDGNSICKDSRDIKVDMLNISTRGHFNFCFPVHLTVHVRKRFIGLFEVVTEFYLNYTLPSSRKGALIY